MRQLHDVFPYLLFPLLVLVMLFGVPAVCDIGTLINNTIYASVAILTLSLALVWGAGGILSLGQTAYFGIGGYTYAVVAINSGSPLLAFGLAVVIAMLAAACLGYFMFWGRMGGIFVAVITLAMAQILQHFFDQTGGSEWRIGNAALGGLTGLPNVPPLNWPPGVDNPISPEGLYAVSILTLAMVYGGCKLLLASRFGRLLIAVSQNEIRCALLGYDVRLYKQMSFVIGAGIAGLAGALFGNTVLINPQMFNLNLSVQIIIFVIVGGVGTLGGPVIACFLIQALTAWLGTVGPKTGFGSWFDPSLVLGCILVLSVILAPCGLVQLLKSISLRLLKYFARSQYNVAIMPSLKGRDT